MRSPFAVERAIARRKRRRPPPSRCAAPGRRAAGPTARRLCTCAAVVLFCLLPRSVLARDQARPGLSPAYFWLSASTCVLSASLGVLFALRVSATYDRARALPSVSPELPYLRRKTRTAEVTADAFFASAAALAVTTVVVGLFTDFRHPPRIGSHEQPPLGRIRVVPAASSHGAALWLRGTLP